MVPIALGNDNARYFALYRGYNRSRDRHIPCRLGCRMRILITDEPLGMTGAGDIALSSGEVIAVLVAVGLAIAFHVIWIRIRGLP